MNIDILRAQYASHPTTEALVQILNNPQIKDCFLSGLTASHTALIFAALQSRCEMSTFFILNDAEEAGYFYHDLLQLCGNERLLFFPSSYRRAIKYGQKDAANQILRTEVLSCLQATEVPRFVVTYPEALAEKVVSLQSLNEHTLALKVNQTFSIAEINQMLRDWSFERVDYVYEPGQFAVRGGIVDVFSFSHEEPFRIDFFGNTIDSIRSFDVGTQLSCDKKESIVIVPQLQGSSQDSVSFFEFILSTSLMVVKELTWVMDAIASIHQAQTSSQALVAELAENSAIGGVHQAQELITKEEFSRQIDRFKLIEFGLKPTRVPASKLTFQSVAQPIFHKNFELVSTSLQSYLAQGYTLYILSDSVKQTDRIKAIFEDRNEKIPFIPIDKTLHAGFVDPVLKLCLFTDHQIFDRFHKYNLKSDKARAGKVALSLKEITLFQPGDFVIHIDHGVGRFGGLMRIPNGNSTQEMVKLVFKNDDVVFVSIHSLHKISKYKGQEGVAPKLSTLGTGAWDKLKERTKSKLKDIARDLLLLYSKRKEQKGFAFTKDSFLQHELEASFIYEDTQDQLKTTQDVKKDMERDQPMDRLICGDVGFGKTEIAIRAAFKAVTDNKQVAVLVPTTVLALQHYKSFSERLKNFPCRVDYISRARTTKQVSAILKELQEGKIDILIGTHRVISKDVKFKDLGLLVIDEEQKFGVSVKERLKQLKLNVDTLTMSATPIPRTLQFSLMGAREISVISTPPPNRHPIQTEVHTFNQELITEAINFEMSRNGQVFIVNNRVSTLPALAEMIKRNIPDARVCIGHGQMDPKALETLLSEFVNFDYDVLIATTIIESGIDIPNVNTMIINNAHHFGLSDLHQLRGRVGRSNRKAFCYLIAPPLSDLTPEARRRLQAIENFADLGSGIHIAMQDLDIRGAGNLLGGEQSGFIADLGYETYHKILNEAVKELKEDEFEDLLNSTEEAGKGQNTGDSFVLETYIESDLELLFPNEYLPTSSERMMTYRELTSMKSEEELALFRATLQDRFGTIPPQGEELLRIVSLRLLAQKLGVEKVVLKGGQMALYFVSLADSPYFQSEAFGKMIVYSTHFPHSTKLRELKQKRSLLIQDIHTAEKALSVFQTIYSIAL